MRKYFIVLVVFLLVISIHGGCAEKTVPKIDIITAEMGEPDTSPKLFSELTAKLAELLLDEISAGRIPDFDKDSLYQLFPRLIDEVETNRNAYLVLITVQNKGWSRDKLIWSKWYSETPSNEIGWIENSQ